MEPGVPEVSGSTRRVQEVSSEAGRSGSGKVRAYMCKIICPGTCYHTTGIMLR